MKIGLICTLIILSIVCCHMACGEEVRPARSPKEKLFYGKGKKSVEINEGRRLISDADSFPREVAKIVSGPTVTARDGSFAIEFSLDKPDDVLVRIVDAKGNKVRDLVCGVLGWNAPEPMVVDSLSQKLIWDGKDAQGKPAPAGCKVQLSVGLTPRLDRFVAHDPEQIMPSVCGLEVDDKGRVYVGLLTSRVCDSHLIRYDRDGNYLETVFPPNPQLLTEDLKDVFRKVDYVDGKAVPLRRGFWPYFTGKLKYGSNNTHWRFPMQIARNGKAYMVDSACERTWVRSEEKGKLTYAKVGAAARPNRYQRMRLMPVKLDPFWWLDYAGRGSGHWAIDPKARFAYVVKGHPNAGGGAKVAQIWKLTLDPWATVDAFEFNATKKLEKKQYWIGTRPKKDERVKSVDMVFNMIMDIDVDEVGNLFVVDARSKMRKFGFAESLLKVFRSNGELTKQIREIELDGKKQPLGDVFGVAVAKNALYVVTRNEPVTKRGITSAWKKARLVKFERSNGTELKAMWSIPVDRTSHLVAVDNSVTPAIVWVGNGGGSGTFTRIVDMGAKAGATKQCGSGIKKNVLLDPWAIALDGKGQLYVYDQARGTIVRTNDDGSEWLESEPINWGQTSFFIDRKREQLYVVGRKGTDRFDLGLKKGTLFAKKVSRRERLMTLGAVNPEGNLLAGDFLPSYKSDKGASGVGEFIGGVHLYGADGKLKTPAYIKTRAVPASIAMDSKGAIYITDVSTGHFQRSSHNLTIGHPEQWYRGKRFTESQSDLTYIAKFPPSGGERCSKTELWAHMGATPVNAGMCICTVASRTLTVDGADRIFSTEYARCHIKVLDTAGNLITRVGAWGNADSRGPKSKFPNPEIAFWWVYSIDAYGDYLYASDRDLRRIAKIRMDYRETKEAKIP